MTSIDIVSIDVNQSGFINVIVDIVVIAVDIFVVAIVVIVVIGPIIVVVVVIIVFVGVMVAVVMLYHWFHLPGEINQERKGWTVQG